MTGDEATMTVAPQCGYMGAGVVTDVKALEADIAFLGVPYGIPYAMGQSRSFGAPAYLREKSSRFRHALSGGYNFDFGGELLDGKDVRIVDCGDVPGDPLDVRGTVERATEIVATILARGAVPIVFGGDDAVPIPVVRAYEEFGPLVVIQIDQHLDFKDEVNGVREGYSSPMRRISEMEWVTQVVQMGQGGIGSALTSDYEEALAAGHLIFTDWDVHEVGMDAVLAEIPEAADYFVTVDYDGLDPSIAPAVSHPEPGGLTFAEAVALLRGLAAKGRIVGMDWVEFVPDHDLHALGAHTTGRLILNTINAMVRAGQFERA